MTKSLSWTTTGVPDLLRTLSSLDRPRCRKPTNRSGELQCHSLFIAACGFNQSHRVFVCINAGGRANPINNPMVFVHHLALPPNLTHSPSGPFSFSGWSTAGQVGGPRYVHWVSGSKWSRILSKENQVLQRDSLGIVI